jgi:ATP-dependent exoDNAse (exonuclease V) alpha subunit
LRLANGEFANIDAINDRRVLLRLDNGRQLSAMLERLRHIDYGYASTSHSAQGATVDRVIVDIDTRLSPELVNRNNFTSQSAERGMLSRFIQTIAASSSMQSTEAARNP